MVKVRAVCRNPNAAEIAAGPCSFTVARRDAEGRQEPCPLELLAASLASCIALTVAAVAVHKGIKLSPFEVEVEMENFERGGRFCVTLHIKDELTERERKILSNSAKYCEVGKLLEGPVEFKFFSS